MVTFDVKILMAWLAFGCILSELVSFSKFFIELKYKVTLLEQSFSRRQSPCQARYKVRGGDEKF